MSRRVVWESREALCYYARSVLGEDVDFGPCLTLGVLDGDKILGVIIFHDWQKDRGTVEITGAAHSPRWCSRDVVRLIYRTCFEQLSANQIVARCDAQNKTTERIFKALGFEVVRLPNMRGPNRDELFFYQTRESWLNTRYSR